MPRLTQYHQLTIEFAVFGIQVPEGRGQAGSDLFAGRLPNAWLLTRPVGRIQPAVRG
jgi:hypothetical protein